MNCRVCQTELQCNSRLDISYYDCPQCGGVWFNGGSIDILLDHKIKLPFTKISGEDTTPDDNATNECPSCGPGSNLRSKTTYATSKVTILGCTICFGHWLSRAQARALVNIVCYSGLTSWLRKLKK